MSDFPIWLLPAWLLLAPPVLALVSLFTGPGHDNNATTSTRY
jgi:hypothetical protein